MKLMILHIVYMIIFVITNKRQTLDLFGDNRYIIPKKIITLLPFIQVLLK